MKHFILTFALALPAAAATKTSTPPTPPLYPTRSTEPIVFIWPPEGFPVSGNGEFILGSVSPATAPFSINGSSVVVHKGGGFITWLPISAGTFTFRAELALASGTAIAERRIVVPSATPPMPSGKPAIDTSSLLPRAETILRAGDWLTVRMRGTPGHPARFRIGKEPWQVMRALPGGFYEGSLMVGPGHEFPALPVEYELGQGWSALRVKGTALVSATLQTPDIATVRSSTAGFTNLRTGPNNGFLIFPLSGTRLPVTGRDGSSLRVRLSNSLSGWISAKDVDVTEGAPAPKAITGTMNVVKSDTGAVLKIGLSEPAAFEVTPSDRLDELTVRLFNSVGHTNWITNEASDFVREIRWKQDSTDSVLVTILLKPGTFWGWWPSYSAGTMNFELRRAPNIDVKKPFAGLKIMLDPGHMPSAPGSTGPLGTAEMDANFAIALAAKERLQRAGATVLMTRKTPLDEVSLVERPKLTIESGADLFISLHNNAIPDGENPFARPHGFSVFYYHPQSLALGRAVQESYRSRLKLPDEGLRWGDLLVARLTAMPAILVENAYMIFPDQEQMLNDPKFRDQLAAALVAGIESFLVETRRRSQ